LSLSFIKIKSINRAPKTNKSKPPAMNLVTVVAPPGRLGIHLDDIESEKSSTIVSAISSGSPLEGKVFQGDYIVSINGVDVREMNTSGENLYLNYVIVILPHTNNRW
jgi:C-terminal processing protease CtpA/Prc